MKPMLLRVLIPLTALALGVAAWYAWAAPREVTEGIVQKILYVHVPCVWTAYLAFFVGLIASIGSLATGKRSWDRVAVSSIEIGVLFCTLVLITGPIWAKPVWGIWWAWDARLTSTLVLWFMYVGYLVVRLLAAERAQAARWSAVVSIIAFLDVPIVHQSVKWWRTLHPMPKALTDGKLNKGLAEGMAAALWMSVLAFTFLYLTMFVVRLWVEELGDDVEAKEEKARGLERVA